ncbi:MAG TPA: tannase/feruloyl esterase family alpha/beta hydrolase, partial [Croceibacterium sp.]|nr:tannase/feruloyl esterase family alpha/beta hydrolase [Croceibacterium sp.]
ALAASGCATSQSSTAPAVAAGPEACSAVTAASFGGTAASGKWIAADAKTGTPAFCEVTGVLSPVATSQIGVVYRLPENWNGKVYGIGGGGWIGNIGIQAASEALGRGYATMQTDGGHPIGNVWDNAWATDPDKAKDFSYRAIHEMTVGGKKLAAAYYGKAHDRAYYVGCSTGGRMGLMEAQRFPKDYDAIVAGAPVYTLQTQTTGLLRSNQFSVPGAAFSAGDLKLAESAALAQCDATDGYKDGLINDPRTCHWDPAEIQCTGAKNATCLAAPQVKALQTLYSGIKSPDGQWAMWPIGRGGESGWSFFIGTDGKPDTTGGGGLLGLKPLIFPERDIDWRNFTADRDVPQVRSSAFAAMYEAKDPNLTPFFRNGGKLLMWHGESDPGPAPTGSIDYARQVVAKNARASSNYRFFLAPGVGHCGGGPGADVLPLIQTIEAWDQTSRAPESMVATKRDAPLVRKACAWPKVARYGGSGDANDPNSWSCVAES